MVSCPSGKVLNTTSNRCVLRTSKVGVVAHNKKLLKDTEVDDVVDAAKNLRTDPASFITKLKKLGQRKHAAITIVILTAVAAGIFGWKTAAAKTIAANVLQKVHRTTKHAKTVVDDLWTRIFRKISKKYVEDVAKTVPLTTLQRSFHWIWSHILEIEKAYTNDPNTLNPLMLHLQKKYPFLARTYSWNYPGVKINIHGLHPSASMGRRRPSLT